MLDSDGYCTMDPDASCWLARANVRMDIRMSASAKRMVDNGLVDENLHVIAMTIRSDQISGHQPDSDHGIRIVTSHHQENFVSQTRQNDLHHKIRYIMTVK